MFLILSVHVLNATKSTPVADDLSIDCVQHNRKYAIEYYSEQWMTKVIVCFPCGSLVSDHYHYN